MKGKSLGTALESGEMLLGCWLNMGSAAAAEMAGLAGFDWVLIDGEHAPYDVAAIMDQLRALEAFETAAVVRVPVGEDWVIKQVLDMGARNLLVPMVETAEQAAALVAATRYPPEGVRGLGANVARVSGYGADADYVAGANRSITLVVQAESRRALENLEAIAAVEGIDGVFIGPADLAASMGYCGQVEAPEVQAAIRDAIGRIRAAGKAAGMLDFDPARVEGYRAAGLAMLALAGDVSLLRQGLRQVVEGARSGPQR